MNENLAGCWSRFSIHFPIIYTRPLSLLYKERQGRTSSEKARSLRREFIHQNSGNLSIGQCARKCIEAIALGVRLKIVRL